MKLLIISDTHIDSIENLPAKVLSAANEVDGIIHAGDVVGLKLIQQLKAVNPNVYAVKGNMDTHTSAYALPATLQLEFEGVKVGVMHGDGSPYTLEARLFYTFPEVDIIIHGHTHIPFWGEVDGQYILNPGSPLSNRGVGYHSYAILEIVDTQFYAEIHKV